MVTKLKWCWLICVLSSYGAQGYASSSDLHDSVSSIQSRMRPTPENADSQGGGVYVYYDAVAQFVDSNLVANEAVRL